MIMKAGTFVLVMALAIVSVLSAQDEIVVTPLSDVAEGLDLQAVGELFAEAENIEAFEKVLNDEETGVNNLDLDEDGQVDFIRVVEEVADETHLIILQVPLGDEEYQDVATIEVEKTGEEEYAMQVHGNEAFYGPDYYVTPTVVYIHTWPIIHWMYRPYYRPYVSVYRWGYYPRWWVRRPHVTFNIYHGRIVHYHHKPRFVVTKTTRVHTVHKVHYTPRHSTRVVRTAAKKPVRGAQRTTVTKKPRGTTVKRSTATRNTQGTTVKKTTVKKSPGGTTAKQTTVKKTPKGAAAKQATVKKTTSTRTRK